MRILWPLLLALLLAAGCKTTGSGNKVYLIRVDKGDTLASIAVKYDTTWEKIAKLNGLAKGAPLKIGAVLRVEPGPGGIVAGAAPAPASARRAALATKLPKKTRSSGKEPAGDIASPDEFTEEDLPEVDRDEETPKKGKGLFFNGKSGAGRSMVWPVYGELSSLYGQRGRRFHHGIDVRARTGTKVVAAGKGTVEFAGRQNGYGKCVIINHGRYKTLYAHLSSIDVDKGDEVDATTEIGAVGTTGNASGPHLHFEVRSLADKSLDPLTYLERDKLAATSH